MLALLVRVLSLLISSYQILCAETPEEYLLQTKSLPDDLNFMPSLANGHLGFTVFGDSIFMAGVYNGAGGESRRARMPNWLNISATICDRFGCMTDADISTEGSTYEMDLQDGYFRYQQTYPRVGITLEQRTYPHRYYTRAMVYEVIATRSAMMDPEATGSRSTRMNSPLYLKLEQHPGADSDAFTFAVVNNGSEADEHRVLRGRTEIVEFERFQNASREIYAVFSENFEQEVRIDLPTWQPELKYRVIVSIDTTESVARKEMEDVQKLSSEELLKSHADAWHDFWNTNFAVEIEGDLELSRIVNAGIFYLVSSMPSQNSNQENLPFYGLSPTGLARGHLDSDYQGHNYLDTEVWILPIMAHISRNWAQELLGYRQRMLSGAQYNAYAKGYKGARFPWQSAYTGTEVTNSRNPEVAQHAIHISADVAFGLEKYFIINHQQEFLCNTAWPILHDIAEFLVSRVACWELFKVCHLLDVTGPDQSHANVDDNAYTNAAAKKTLDFAAFAGGKCGDESQAEQIANWQSVADQLLIPYDSDLDYHPQYTGYQHGVEVQQADAILLGFPLHYSMSKSTRLNDLDAYAAVMSDSASSMTWFALAINFFQTSASWRADDYFERGYKNFVRPEFKVWSDKPIGQVDGAANYLPGIGGLLQTLLTGYGGIDYERRGEKSTEIHRAVSMPRNVSKVVISFIRYGVNTCKLEFSSSSNLMRCGY